VVCLTIEVALLISGVSVAFGIFAGISNLRRNQKLDDEKINRSASAGSIAYEDIIPPEGE